MDIQSHEELVIANINPPKSIIGGGVFYENSKIILYGLPKTFKSLLSQQLAFCLASGAPWLGFSTSPSRVLFIQREVGRFQFRLRTLTMGKNLVVPKTTLFWSSDFTTKVDTTAGMNHILSAINKTKSEVLVLDPFYKFLLSSDESSVQRAIDNLDALIDQTKISIFIVAHSRKPRYDTGGKTIDGGGSELRGPLLEMWADGLIRVQGDIATDLRQLDFELRHAPSIIPTMNIRLNRGQLWFHSA